DLTLTIAPYGRFRAARIGVHPKSQRACGPAAGGIACEELHDNPGGGRVGLQPAGQASSAAVLWRVDADVPKRCGRAVDAFAGGPLAGRSRLLGELAAVLLCHTGAHKADEPSLVFTFLHADDRHAQAV